MFCCVLYNINTNLLRRKMRCVRCIARLSRCADMGVNANVVPVDRCLGVVAAIKTSKTICTVLLTFKVLFPGRRLFVFPLPFPVGTGFFIVKCTLVRLCTNFTGGPNSGITRFTRLKKVVFKFVLVVC